MEFIILDTIHNPLFTDLENYLRNQQWQKADKETDRLLLKLGDKENQDYLDYDDFRNFPKKYLTTIDRLWLGYSDNHFGLSIQKQIYLDHGGKLNDFNWDAYKKMAEVIGWTKKDPWLSYRKYTFKINAPSGHLPSLLSLGNNSKLYGGLLGVGWSVTCLFSSVNDNT